MKRIYLAVSLALMLVASVFAALPAASAAEEGQSLDLFVRRDECGNGLGDPRLSLEDGDDAACGFSDNMLSDVYAETGVFVPDTAFPAAEGVPATLDASRPVTGVITIRSFNGAGAGLAELDLTLTGTSGGEEKVIGTWATSYEAAPTESYAFEYEMEPDAALDKTTFEGLTLRVFTHGVTAGMHGWIELDEPPATISIPTVGGEVKPGNSDPGKKKDAPAKKGCKKAKKGKGKAKKKGCNKGKGPQEPPAPPAAACDPYVPGEEGAEAETAVVTDEHTAEAPLEITVTHAAPPDSFGESFWHNVQVDSEAAEAGLYISYEFAEYEDHDLYVNYADGTEAASVGGFNPAPVVPQLPEVGGTDGTGNGGHSEIGAEILDGLRTADCAGYTVDFHGFLTEGGDYTAKLWLGEVQNDPAPPAS